jgi:hypothetical protein
MSFQYYYLLIEFGYFQFLDVLSKVRDMSRNQKTKDSDLNYMNWSIEKYYEYIMSALTPFLFPY